MPGESRIPSADYEAAVFDFATEAVKESEAFLKQQPGYGKIQECISMINGDNADIRSAALSRTTCNHFGKSASDIAAMLTDVKPFWEYQTKNERYQKQAFIMGNLATCWYPRRMIDVRLTEAMKWYEVAGSGYTHMFWDVDIQDINVLAEDPRDVLPIRPASNSASIQEAFGVVIRRSRTVNYLRHKFPSKWKIIRADHDGSAVTTLMNTRAGKLLGEILPSPFRDALFGGGPNSRMARIPTCDEYAIYLHDDARNETGRPIPVGQFGMNPADSDSFGKPLNNWSYWVDPGEKMYPRGRCIQVTNYGVLNDGPNIYWHGMFPISKITLDPWPWTFLGKAPLWDLVSMQKSLDRTLRVIDDHIAKTAEPDVIADKNSVSRASLDKWNTRRPGGKYQHNPIAGKGVQLVYPPPLPPDVFNHRDWLIEKMDSLSGVRDLSQLMKLNQLPSDNTIEKIQDAMSPSIRYRSRMLESFMREFAMMAAYNFAQFYTLPMRYQMLGAQGVTSEDFDYDPETLIPQFIHADDFDHNGTPSIEAITRGPLPRHERAQEFLRQFTYEVSPGSLLAASQIERQMIYLQLARAGWMDYWSLMEQLNIPNVGRPPQGADTIPERLAAQQQMGLGMQVNPAGRKASGEAGPRIVTKESK